jgi:acyl-CoA thioesterase-2
MNHEDGPLTVVVESESVVSAAMTRGRIGQIFGGQLAAHSMTAGAAAVPDELAAHSLHLVFLAAGDAGERMRYTRSIVKQGRSLSVVRVDATQGDRLLATSLVTCQTNEQSGEHGLVAEVAPAP